MLGEVAEKKLYDAAAKGNAQALRDLLKDPLLLDRVSFTCSNKTPLHVAAMHGHLPIVQEILRQNRQLAEELDSQKSSALHIASAKGYVEMVNELLSAAPDMCLSRDSQGRNPLHLAAMKGHVRILAGLVQTAPLAAREKLDRGQNVLHLCVKHRQLESLRILVQNLSELLNAEDDDGDSILHLAVRFKQVERKGEMNIANNYTNLHNPEAKTKSMQTVQYLVESTNIDKDAKNCKGQTPLHILEQIPADDRTKAAIREFLGPPLCTSSSRQTQPAKWLTRKRDSIMVVAILIATMAFQAGVNPAGGFWQDNLTQDSQGNPVPNPHMAGEAVMAYNHPKVFKILLKSNTVAFVSSLSTILLLISGLPFRRRLFMWALMAIMWLAVTSIAVSYAAAIVVVTPRKYKESLGHVIWTGITVWWIVMGALLAVNTLRLISRWLQSKGVKLWPPKRFRNFIEHHNSNEEV
ncbi:UNVERIFIED_CONTAM: hypothetical protein Slati_1864200 [Sesamum latifolium]|uniref:PGG domain-containing protein n=1 Tax=Sesamum latifolium TaxID=2727402 RepID=A0AAW2X0S1_9LAMI